jgi:hypothetical protein
MPIRRTFLPDGLQEYALLREGLTPWIAGASIHPRANRRQEIANGIRSCNGFIPSASQTHFSSYVAIEIAMTIGIWHEEANPPDIPNIPILRRRWNPTILTIYKAYHLPMEMMPQRLCDMA